MRKKSCCRVVTLAQVRRQRAVFFFGFLFSQSEVLVMRVTLQAKGRPRERRRGLFLHGLHGLPPNRGLWSRRRQETEKKWMKSSRYAFSASLPKYYGYFQGNGGGKSNFLPLFFSSACVFFSPFLPRQTLSFFFFFFFFFFFSLIAPFPLPSSIAVQSTMMEIGDLFLRRWRQRH